MAGYVRAHLEIHADESFDVMPIACPAVDEHTQAGLRCYTRHADGWQRACVYYVSACSNDNVTERIHPTSLFDKAEIAALRQIRCGVICQRQRGNRPPGC